MKKVLSVILCVLLLCTACSACSENSSEESNPSEETSSPVNSLEDDLTWDVNPDPLVVCFDISDDDAFAAESCRQAIANFHQQLTYYNGHDNLPIRASDVELLVIPGGEVEPAERSSMLQKIRTDIMAGKGPDVFVCVSHDRIPQLTFSTSTTRLFNYPEITRESGLFLPLDDLLPEFAMTDVDDLYSHVLDGGRNQKGELVMIPLNFSVPGIFFPGADTPDCDYKGTSWDDVLQGSDPLLAEQSVWAMNFLAYDREGVREGHHRSGLPYLFPELADTETGKLAFSEEELLNTVKASLSAYRAVTERETTQKSSSEFFYAQTLSGGGLEGVSEEEKGLYTLSPLRNLNGGSTAVVNVYCAVNSQTEKKEQAIALLDALLCKDMQQGGIATLFGMYLGLAGMPMNREICTPDCPYLEGSSYIQLEQFDLWQEVCEDINVVRFPSPLDMELDSMMMEIEDTMGVYYNPYNSELILRDGRFITGDITDGELREIVSKYYQRMQRLVDES